METESRKRVFGGTAGLWLLRKQRDRTTGMPPAKENNSHPVLQSQSNRHTSETSGQYNKKRMKTDSVVADNYKQPNGRCERGIERESEFTAQSSGNKAISSSCLFEWDDVRCRPVYVDENDDNTPYPIGTPATESTNESVAGLSSHTSNKTEKNFRSRPSTLTRRARAKNPIAGKSTTRKRKQRRRVFGVRKRHFVSNKSGGATSNDDTTDCSTDSSTTSSIHSTSDENISLQQNNGLPVESVGLLSTTSSTSFVSHHSYSSTTSDANSSDHSLKGVTENDLPEEATNVTATAIFNDCSDSSQSQQPKDTTHFHSQESQSSSMFDFDKHQAMTGSLQKSSLQQTLQLGYQTPLDVARAFLEQLDSDQTLLNLEDVSCSQETCSGKKLDTRTVVATTRGKLSQSMAQTEYRKYCQACREANVKPFSMRVFLEQRSSCFRTGDVFDGMFDE